MTDLLVSKHDNILKLTLDRPHKMNALNSNLYRLLITELNTAAVDDNVKVVILTGANGIFTAGNDIQDFLDHISDLDNYPAVEFLETLVTFPKPIIATVQVLALGVGVTILQHCDFVYATPKTRFHMPFVDLGLVPEGGSSLILPGMIGHAKANRYLMLAEEFRADTAEQIGLVTEVVEDADLYSESVAKRLTAKPIDALIATKRLTRCNTGQVIAVIRQEAEVFKNRLKDPKTQARLRKVIE